MLKPVKQKDRSSLPIFFIVFLFEKFQFYQMSMKNLRNTIILILFATLSNIGLAQEAILNTFTYQINRVHPAISITKSELLEAKTLLDLNRHYKPDWVKEYILVEVVAQQNGKIKKVSGENNQLNQAQKVLLKNADAGQAITVNIEYLPENNLKDNPIKTTDFSFSVDPDQEATFTEGLEQLKNYLEEKAINFIPEGTFKNYDLAAIKFTVNEKGEIVNPHVFWSSKDEAIDGLLLKTVQEMPCWKPATYTNGLKVKQEFALTVGNMENCAVNLLNFRLD